MAKITLRYEPEEDGGFCVDAYVTYQGRQYVYGYEHLNTDTPDPDELAAAARRVMAHARREYRKHVEKWGDYD